MKNSIIPFLLLNTILLVGCSHSTVNTTPSATPPQQVEQLATLIASGNFLRDNCQRSDIPTAPKLQQTALLQAQNKGWQLNSARQQEVQHRAERILSDLNQDGTPIAEKCAYFNQHLVAFIEQARH